jgi:Ohr subfamily peroxiredoxin
MNKIDNVFYTGKTHTTGGREGAARSDDGRLDVVMSAPGSHGKGTNPEQLFAAGWSACFIGALGLAARDKHVALPAETAVDAEVDLGGSADGFALQARLRVSIPGLPHDLAQELIDTAHQTCPYSKMTRNNINVDIALA